MKLTKPKSKPSYRVRFTFNNIKRTIILDKSKSLSEYMCGNLERIIKYKQAGIPLMPDLLDFLNSNSVIRKKLEEWDIIEKSQRIKPTNLELIEEHIIEKINISEKRKKELRQSLRKIIKHCNAVYPNDLSLNKVKGYLIFLHEQNLSARTCNKHLQIAKQFTTWLDIKGYASIDLRAINRLNEDKDKRYKRRPLTDSESKILLNNMRDKHHGLSCDERRMVYLFGLEIGFRWNEIVTLTVGDIDLISKTVTIKAENEKAGRGTEKPLPKKLYVMLSNYLESPLRLPSCRLFENMWQDKGAEMLQKDLDYVGINWRRNIKGEVIDFHALRHTFGTRLARAGVTPQKLQNLMRHSDINLTMKYYVHLTVEDNRSAIDSLPSLYG